MFLFFLLILRLHRRGRSLSRTRGLRTVTQKRLADFHVSIWNYTPPRTVSACYFRALIFTEKAFGIWNRMGVLQEFSHWQRALGPGAAGTCLVCVL